jgi:DNA-binding NarL/FixJ family response regulator
MKSRDPQEGGALTAPFDVVIVSSSPVMGVALQHLLEDRPDGLTTYRLEIDELLSTPQVFSPDLLVLAPQSWHDFALWVPHLQTRLSACPWLLFSDPRIAGLFISRLEALNCGFVPTTAPPVLLRAAIHALADQPVVSCLSLFTRLLATATGAASARSGIDPLTVEELQCGCAVSLGLSDHEVAELTGQRVTVIRRHVRALMLKLEVSGREELAEVVRKTLTPANVIPLCRELLRGGVGQQKSDS